VEGRYSYTEEPEARGPRYSSSEEEEWGTKEKEREQVAVKKVKVRQEKTKRWKGNEQIRAGFGTSRASLVHVAKIRGQQTL
jgi:hypothetical protein